MSKHLSVLFLCGWYPSRVSPYNGDFIQRHAEAVATLHDVTVIHIITDSALKNTIEYTFNNTNGIKTHIAYLKPQKKLNKALLFFKAFKNLIAKVGAFDVVHLNEVFPFGIFSLYLKWFSQKPYIISEHWTVYHRPKSISYFEKKISNIITKNAAYVCPVSDNLGGAMQAIGLQGNYKKVPNVVDTTVFTPNNINQDIFTITHISNMNNDHKNIKGMLDVVAVIQKKIQNFKFQLIGENATNYKVYANELGIEANKINFFEQIPHQEVSEKLKNSHLFVMFSNYENLPCVILEAFSCGVPVISTNVGGIHEFFPNNFGKLIEVGDEAKLKEEILNFYNKTHTLASKAQMHNYVVSVCSKKTIAENFSELYYKSLKR
ncbi:glycosyltransferase family 4 protein [Polaribacter sp. R77954]|uniref:glycosyltransferase family 4 protein n=1 Tax=Polaribacter sp. R77954 TaxID=3093870 RepID=UPI0037C5AADC